MRFNSNGALTLNDSVYMEDRDIMDTDTRAIVGDYLTANGTPAAIEWVDSLSSADITRPVSLKNWIRNHDIVDTIQVTVRNDTVVKVWAPYGREVDTSKSSGVSFDGSFRDYLGLVHVAHSDTVWVGRDFDTLVAYRAV